MKKEKINEQEYRQNHQVEENMIDKEIDNQEVEQDSRQVLEEQEEAEVKREIESEIAEIEKVKGELEEIKDKYIRLYSEFENFRKRTAKEKLELIKTGNEDLMNALLPVIDDFQRARAASTEHMDVAPTLEGYELIYNKLYKILEQKGLKSMDVAQGTDFNPELHDAIAQIPAPEESLKGKVVDVTQQGYYLGEKVIRFAKVVIGS